MQPSALDTAINHTVMTVEHTKAACKHLQAASSNGFQSDLIVHIHAFGFTQQHKGNQ